MIFLIGFISISIVLGQATVEKNPLILFVDTTAGEYGYKNLNGDTIIPLGKYTICYTDTFKTYAIVAVPYKGFVAIDRQENVIYHVFAFDNGPDYVSEGLFRIVIEGKIGYADSATGKIIIRPQFDCARPFENGIAEVSTNCRTQYDGEHSTWLSDSWFYIDRTGKRVKPPIAK